VPFGNISPGLFEWAVLSFGKCLGISKALVHECVQTLKEKTIRCSCIPFREFKHGELVRVASEW